MKKTHKIIMLHTKDETNLRVDNNGNITFEPNIKGLYYNGLEHVYQHLYIISGEETKANDWYINLHDNKIGQYGENQTPLQSPWVQKVSATTDPKLNRYIENDRGEGVDEIFPQIPQSFIESYAKSPVDEVTLKWEFYDGHTYVEKRLKLVDNEVVVVEPKPYIQKCGRIERVYREKLYTRKEVEKLHEKLHLCIRDIEMVIGGECDPDEDSWQATLNNLYWIKENL